MGRPAARDRRERRGPPARQEQEPRPDRSVGAREAQVWLRPPRRYAVDPIAGGIGDRSGGGSAGVAHYRRMLPFSVSNTPLPPGVAAGAPPEPVPSAPERPRLAGGGAPAPCAAALHTRVRSSTVFAWLPFTCSTSCWGILQAAWLSRRYFSVFASTSA